MSLQLISSRSPRLIIAAFFCAFILIGGVILAVLKHQSVPGSEDISNGSGVFPGFTVSQIRDPDNDTALVITSLRTGSEAEQKGIAVGDRLLAINRKPVDTVYSAEALLGEDTHNQIALQLVHNRQPIDVSLSRDKERIHGP
jgi:S1-C subfamily serine protease